MRNVVLAALAVCGYAMINATPAAAFAPDHPFCLQGWEHPGLGDCSFDTYQQCLATASGQRLFCNINPYFAATRYQRGHRGRAVRRPDYYYY